jgi:hypothetical protein
MADFPAALGLRQRAQAAARGGRWASIGFAEEEGFDWVCWGGGDKSDKTRGSSNTTRKRYPRIEAEGCCILQRNHREGEPKAMESVYSQLTAPGSSLFFWFFNTVLFSHHSHPSPQAMSETKGALGFQIFSAQQIGGLSQAEKAYLWQTRK